MSEPSIAPPVIWCPCWESPEPTVPWTYPDDEHADVCGYGHRCPTECPDAQSSGSSEQEQRCPGHLHFHTETGCPYTQQSGSSVATAKEAGPSARP
jgi:hypothetical protein